MCPVTVPSAQFPFQKLNFGSRSRKTCKSRYQNFCALFSFTRFLNFVPNILPRIIDKLIKKIKLRLDKFPKIEIFHLDYFGGAFNFYDQFGKILWLCTKILRSIVDLKGVVWYLGVILLKHSLVLLNHFQIRRKTTH